MSPLQREPWLLFCLWQNLFSLCVQTSFLVFKHVKSRLAAVHRGYNLSSAFGFVLAVLCFEKRLQQKWL